MLDLVYHWKSLLCLSLQETISLEDSAIKRILCHQHQQKYMYEESHFFTLFFLTFNATMPKRLISVFSCWMQNSAVTKVISKIVSIFSVIHATVEILNDPVPQLSFQGEASQSMSFEGKLTFCLGESVATVESGKESLILESTMDGDKKNKTHMESLTSAN